MWNNTQTYEKTKKPERLCEDAVNTYLRALKNDSANDMLHRFRHDPLQYFIVGLVLRIRELEQERTPMEKLPLRERVQKMYQAIRIRQGQDSGYGTIVNLPQAVTLELIEDVLQSLTDDVLVGA